MALASVMASLFSGKQASSQINHVSGKGYYYRSDQPRIKSAKKSRLSKRKPHRVLKKNR
jgi:hypothetical protein